MNSIGGDAHLALSFNCLWPVVLPLSTITGWTEHDLAATNGPACAQRRAALLSREVFYMCLGRAPEVKYAAPQERDQVPRTPGAPDLVAEALVGIAGYKRLRLADRGLHHVRIELGRDRDRTPVRRQL